MNSREVLSFYKKVSIIKKSIEVTKGRRVDKIKLVNKCNYYTTAEFENFGINIVLLLSR